jgi:DNA mismatch repair ATPase MutS
VSAEDRSPAGEIARLDRLVDLLESRKNPLFAPIALLLVWVPQLALATEAWRARVGHRVARWIAIAGEIEALAALSGYAYEHPEDPFPDVVEGDVALFAGEGLGHPLRPAATFVRNDLRLDDSTRVLVVSGSNMSGKSTFLRTAGANTVLALAGAPVRARTLRLSALRVGASIQIHDSLAEGQSRFYAEILRLRQVLGLAKEGEPVLFLLDEILHGTNSHDRRIGAEAVIRSLLRHRTIGLVTTHDLALARNAEDPSVAARNVHFEDEIADGKMLFDYRLREGVVQKSNALALMREVGLEV